MSEVVHVEDIGDFRQDDPSMGPVLTKECVNIEEELLVQERVTGVDDSSNNNACEAGAPYLGNLIEKHVYDVILVLMIGGSQNFKRKVLVETYLFRVLKMESGHKMKWRVVITCY